MFEYPGNFAITIYDTEVEYSSHGNKHFMISQDTINDVTIMEVSGHELFLRWSRSSNVQWMFEISNGVSLL